MTAEQGTDRASAVEAPLSPEELAVWRGFLRWSESVTGQVGADVLAGSGLSRPEYDVLRRLLDRGGALRQHELQRALRWSASRASHQLRRMSDRGLLTREDAGPGRPVLVAILPPGRDRMSAADAVHARSVRQHLLRAMPGDAAGLSTALAAIGAETAG